jgi:phosphoribosylformylglycinamidine synthase subunit PurSL
MAIDSPHIVSVSLLPSFSDPRGNDLIHSIRRFLDLAVEQVQIVQVYRIFKHLSNEELKCIVERVLLDPVIEHALQRPPGFNWLLEIRLKKGLTDNLGITAQISIEDFLKSPFAFEERVESAKRYLFKGPLSCQEVERIGKELLANPLIEEIQVERIAADQLVEEIDISGQRSRLLEISQARQLALNGAEMEAIQSYYQRQSVREARKQFDLPPNPTDVELESIAQTWSEHCKHKIFQARIHYFEGGKEIQIDNIFSTYIKRATEILSKKIDWLVSVFQDNAGIIRFNASTYLTCKVETHNSPSALDPYGGALTGILGVNRDILGTGFGSRPIANMDVLCFAPPDYEGPIPEKLLHPKRVLAGVCKGIEHGGNKSGIPTVNGAILFDERFLGKPLVYCGTIGLMPAAIGLRKSEDKEITPGDWIAIAGGKTGKDGIHGATFSSEELHEQSPSSAVQIGDPFTQKKLLDFILEARDRGLYRTLTDNGAGGISSSVGEMARISGGCEIHLDRVPLKCPSMSFWEILLSESQERMTFAVPAECKEDLEALATFHEVNLAYIGTFTASGLFHVLFGGRTVARLDLDFLHQGPMLDLEAEWNEPVLESVSIPASNFGEDLHRLLSCYTICSKEMIVRQYDHEVQGGSCLKPFVGAASDGPSDASIILPIEFQVAGEGVVVSNGICPRYSEIDTDAMAAYSVNEAICNQVAVGADPTRIAILDNFCWPDPIYDPVKTPDGKHKLAQLVRAARALYRAAVDLETPIISGKDSMKNDYKMKGIKISIPPTLLITAVGKIPNVKKAVSMDVKQPNDLVYVAGWTKNELGGSEYFAMKKLKGGLVPRIDFIEAKKLYRAIFEAIQAEEIASCHDCSEGGLGVAMAESSFSGGLGLDIDLKRVPREEDVSDGEILFSESAGRFVLTIDPILKERFEERMRDLPVHSVGLVRDDEKFIVRGLCGDIVIQEDVMQLKKSWQEPLRKL